MTRNIEREAFLLYYSGLLMFNFNHHNLLWLFSAHIQSMAAAGEEVRTEVDKFKNAFALMALKVR